MGGFRAVLSTAILFRLSGLPIFERREKWNVGIASLN
tara:strand:- start:2843 stop:2953 length:111 start_codon:yes stop_codon:yes gene_type:complete